MRWLLILLLLLVTWLGARELGSAIWYDEWFSIKQAGGGMFGPLTVGDVWQQVINDIFETPAHYILLSEWGKLVGWTEFAARALSLLLGLLAICALYRLGRDLFSPLAGVSAAVIFGLSAFYINYLHEMRTYTLLALLSIVVIWAYWRVAHTAASRWHTALLVLCTAALLYAHYMGALVPAGLALYHLLFMRKDRRWWRIVGLFGLALLLFAVPWSGEIIHTITYARTSETRQMIALSTPDLLAQAAWLYTNASVAFFALLIVGAVGSRGIAVRFVWCLALGTLGVGILVNTLLPVLNHARYLMPAWPALALLAGLGVQKLHTRRISAGAILGIWAAAGLWQTSSPAFASRILGGAFAPLPWHTLVDALDARVGPDDVIAYHRPDDVWAIEQIFAYYLHDLPARHTIMELLPGRADNDEFLHQAQQFVGTAPRVWLAVDRTKAPNFRLDAFRRALANDYATCGKVFDLPALSLDLYARRPDGESAFRFGEGIQLALVEPVPKAVRQTLHLTLGWLVAADVPPYTYSAGLHIISTEGQLVAQADFGLPEAGFTCQFAQIDLSSLPSGEYQALATVYAYETGARLPGQSASQATDRLLLGAFHHEG